MVDDNGEGFSFAGRFTGDELDRLRLGPISIKERTRTVGGVLTVESNPGHGARLTIEVPLGANMAKTKQQIRVLMADDHAIFRDGLRKLLDGDEDITIVGEAQNGNECIKLLAKLKPDILLLDLRMPDKDGLAVLEEVNFDTIADARDRADRRGRRSRCGARDAAGRARRGAEAIGDGFTGEEYSPRVRAVKSGWIIA